MKRLTLILLVTLLAGCGVLQPVPPTPQPTPVPPTPQVILATVLVTVIPTERPTMVPVPTNTPLPTLALPTGTPAVESTPATEAPASGAEGSVTVPPSFYGSTFSKIVFSDDSFSLRCEGHQSITFDLTASDIYVAAVEFYYRIHAKGSTDVPDWSRGGTLQGDGGGHFFLTYNADQVAPDNRKANGWFDIQFVGLNKLGQVVGRTEKIVELVTYTLDCP